MSARGRCQGCGRFASDLFENGGDLPDGRYESLLLCGQCASPASTTESKEIEAMNYKRHTLGDLIAALRELPAGSEVNGLSESIDSYRGYYERNAISPDWNGQEPAHRLAEAYQEQIGKAIFGYKGGDYRVSGDELVYLAGYGDTGPAIIGLKDDPVSGIYEPVLLDEDWHF